MTAITSLPLRFSDEILVPCPPAKVWPVLANIAEYSQWWPRYLLVRFLHPAPHFIGTEFVIRPYGWRSILCRVTSFEEPACICLQYDGTYMRGAANWRLESGKDGTRVIYEMDAVVNDLAVYLVSFIASLKSIHSFSMRGIFMNLTKQLAD
ncbi:SRPBCC family protein [uncultured Desulfobulbus sp.]|uniref:SRPBCC family protein n=1 Tax=uncultured Desulfobulbus sp. TaxID=239745 RepID=UPI00374D94F1